MRKHRDCTEITGGMTWVFVENTVVYKAVRSAAGQKARQIEVHLSFIGQFVLPRKARVKDDEQEHTRRRPQKTILQMYNRTSCPWSIQRAVVYLFALKENT